ncbi:thioredoxin-like protein [Clathrospora elynae]|uniref:Thioredoxin-like protein n=1 Tax=Clathrospora elynae TaxID=706981 RepID=A0A6A5SMQ7_9PLEO|nr:thioredoxin-like protein [Clathrospora elynae]
MGGQYERPAESPCWAPGSRFHCEAVISGVIEDASLGTYIHQPSSPSTPDTEAPCLILMFIPAAFSFVCPTEVLAFQNFLDEFKDRNCSVLFISVDTKHLLWYWQNVPRQYGGLGQIDILLLSDANHRIARDYRVLIEEESVSLREMFIIDGQGVVQQVTLNNNTVGRSVLEALHFLQAFQAVARHGVLCPIDWKSSSSAIETISTISNTITEPYKGRLANLQKEFGVQVKDLDAKHKQGDGDDETSPKADMQQSEAVILRSSRSYSSPLPSAIKELEQARLPAAQVMLSKTYAPGFFVRHTLLLGTTKHNPHICPICPNQALRYV